MATANLARLLRWNVVRRADKEALVDGDRRWSFAELDADVEPATPRRCWLPACSPATSSPCSDELLHVPDRDVRDRTRSGGAPAAQLAPPRARARLHRRSRRGIDAARRREFHGKAEALVGTGNVAASSPTRTRLLRVGRRCRSCSPACRRPRRRRWARPTCSASSIPPARPHVRKGMMISNGNVIANQLGQILELS